MWYIVGSLSQAGTFSPVFFGVYGKESASTFARPLLSSNGRPSLSRYGKAPFGLYPYFFSA